MKPENAALLKILKDEFKSDVVTKQQINSFCEQTNLPYPNWIYTSSEYNCGVEKYNLCPRSVIGEVTYTINNSLGVISQNEDSGLIPSVDPLYVKFGAYTDILDIIESKSFYPVFVTGLSGNGKTQMVEQICAAEKRELFRVNITVETDEDDLLGGFRLVQDTTKWFDGPVIRAMKSGGILLLDEVDLASNKIMCLQPVLEGKGVFLKKINQFIKPAKGFNIIATANTKGQGNESGKFVGTNFLNEAFLERFPITIEQRYPTEAIERKILKKILQAADVEPPEDYVNVLVDWAKTNRLSYSNEVETEVISTRRLVHIVNAFIIFKDPRKAVEMCVSRFDEITKSSLIGLYDSLDASSPVKKVEKSKVKSENSVDGLFGS